MNWASSVLPMMSYTSCAVGLRASFLAIVAFAFRAKEMYGAEIHQKVRYCVSQSGNTDALVVSQNLRLRRSSGTKPIKFGFRHVRIIGLGDRNRALGTGDR